MVFQEGKKGCAGARMRALQMQVRNKECGRHCHCSTLPKCVVHGEAKTLQCLVFMMPEPKLSGFYLLDDHVGGWHIGKHAGARSFHGADGVDHFFALGHFTEYGVAPAVLAWVVQETVVLHVDEELGRGRVRVRGTRHCQRVWIVFQAVLGFVFHGGVGWLLFHAWLETAALYHEDVDHAVENRVVVVAGSHVGQEVGNRFGAFSASSSAVILPRLVVMMTEVMMILNKLDEKYLRLRRTVAAKTLFYSFA